MIKQAIIAASVFSALLTLSAGASAANSIPDGTQIAREASEGPRGQDNERPGDRQRRGGRNVVEPSISVDLLAREASEGPRGQDNERPGDRQRRGGRG